MHKNTKSLGIIPARYASSRFPGKPLIDILGKTMIQRVYEQVAKASEIDRVVVATDDKRIFEHVKSFDGEVFMTSKKHRSGTDRCAEIIEKEGFRDFEIILNIQGDEPFIAPTQIDSLIHFLKNQSSFQIATLSKKIKDKETLFNPSAVKVVFGKEQQALYFSRQTIPFIHNLEKDTWLSNSVFFKHIGLYAFRKSALQMIADLPQSPLEKAESLEQLRWLENGMNIGVTITELETIGIDTPADLEKVRFNLSNI